MARCRGTCLLGGLLFAFAASAAWAQNDVCIPVAGTPTLDGQVEGDAGWQGSARIDLDFPGVAPDTYARLGRTGTHLYVGFVCRNSNIQADGADRIVLAFATGADADAWRIHIEPF